jgi:hypothetical protein
MVQLSTVHVCILPYKVKMCGAMHMVWWLQPDLAHTTPGSYIPTSIELQWHLSLGYLISFLIGHSPITTFCTYGS